MIHEEKIIMKKISILLLLAIILSSCVEKKYDWSTSISAPKEYPVVIQRGFMGKSFFGPSCISSCWGIGMDVAKKQAFNLPDTFEITWLSLIERKFYKGKWILPKDKIKHYFENGFNYGNKKIDYNKIIIGLAPKGTVVLWLSGDHGIQIEIGKYQATQVFLESNDVSDSSKFMFENGFIDKKLADPKFISSDIKEKIKAYGYPSSIIYDVYREKYSWQPEVILPGGSKISSINIKMCNGEKKIISNSIHNIEQKSIPYLIKIIWKNKKGGVFESNIVFINDDDLKKNFNNKKEELPLNFERNSILVLFKEKINKNLPAKIIIKFEKESISNLFLEQDNNKYEISDFNEETQKVVIKTPCICK